MAPATERKRPPASDPFTATFGGNALPLHLGLNELLGGGRRVGLTVHAPHRRDKGHTECCAQIRQTKRNQEDMNSESLCQNASEKHA